MDIKLKDSKDFSQRDIEQLIELYQELRWTKEREARDIAEMLKNTTLVVSLWDDSLLVGFARVISDLVYRATIWDVVVRPEYRGKGLGSMLVRAVIDHPKLARVERFWLVTARPEFYGRFGFEHERESMVLDRTGCRRDL